MEKTETITKPEQPKEQKEVALLKGFSVSIHTSTEQRLNIQVKKLTPEVFKQMTAELEDWFQVVDSQYKKTYVKGRNWIGRGRRMTSGGKKSKADRRRVLIFSPFPSRYSNILRTIRRDIYDYLRKHSIILAQTQRGAFNNNIYLIPYANVVDLDKFISKLNKKIDHLNEDIVKYLTTKRIAEVQAILDKHHTNIQLSKYTWNIERVYADYVPLALEPTAVKEMVQDQYEKMYTKLDETEKNRLEALDREIEAKRKQRIKESVENLGAKTQAIVKRVVASKRLKPETIKKDLEELHNLASSVGLDSFSKAVIDPVMLSFQDPERALEMFGTNDLGEGVSSKIQGFVSNL